MLVNTQGSSMKAVSSWACQVALFTLCCASVTTLPCNTGWTNAAIRLAEPHHMLLGGTKQLVWHDRSSKLLYSASLCHVLPKHGKVSQTM